MRAVFLAIAVLLFAHSSQALSWGADGHSVVAEIAERRLSAEARAEVEELLGPGVSLASISSWADDVRSERRETSNWHFVDMPLAETQYDPAKYCKKNEKRGDCVIAAIGCARRELACTTIPTQRAEALKFLVHFVGDLHQPLHTMEEERGGNGFDVIADFPSLIDMELAMATNLHVIWDSRADRADHLGMGQLRGPAGGGLAEGEPRRARR